MEEPIWTTKRRITELLAVPPAQLDLFVAQRFVRSAKFGNSTQSRKVYNFADVKAVLIALDAGRQPQTFGGRTKVSTKAT